MSMCIKGMLCILLLFGGCARRPLEECYAQGQKVAAELSQELHSIHSLDLLIQKSPLLKKKMRKLTHLMIQAEDYHRKYPQDQLSRTGSLISDQLRYEILRLCEEVEGAQSCLEELQEEMLDQLDLHERRKKQFKLR